MAKTATAPAPKAKAPAAKKAAAPKAAAEKAKSERPAEFGIERKKDLPWSDKKVAVLSALKKLKATNEQTAKGAKDVVEASDGSITNRDVRHYCYHAKAGGLVDVYEAVEGTVGYRFALTAAAKAMDFGKEFAKQVKAKEDAKAKPAKKDKE